MPTRSVPSILHISDVHFGPAHQSDRCAAVLALIGAREPDAVVLSGDLTQRAKPAQFRQARAFVDRIGPPVLVVPGNHDVPLFRFWERLLAPLGAYKKHFSTDLEPRLELPGLVAAGLNTAFNWTFTGGRVLRRKLRAAVDLFHRQPATVFRLAVMHHHLVPPPTLAAPRVAWGAARALHDLAEGGVDLVLAGHLHRSFVAQVASPSAPEDPPMVIVHTGTTTSSRGRAEERGRNSCNWIAVGNDATKVTRLEWRDSDGGFADTGSHSFPRRRAAPSTGMEPHGHA